MPHPSYQNFLNLEPPPFRLYGWGGDCKNSLKRNVLLQDLTPNPGYQTSMRKRHHLVRTRLVDPAFALTTFQVERVAAHYLDSPLVRIRPLHSADKMVLLGQPQPEFLREIQGCWAVSEISPTLRQV